MKSSQEVFRLDTGKPQHLRNLVKGKSLVAIALQCEGFQGTAGQIATGSRKPLGDIVGDAQRELLFGVFYDGGVCTENCPLLY